MSIESVLPSNHLILCHPLLLLPSVFPNITVFSIKSVLCIRWPKYWSFSISPSNEYSGLIYLKIDWFDLAVQRTLKSLLQHHSSKALIIWTWFKSINHLDTVHFIYLASFLLDITIQITYSSVLSRLID